MERTTVVIDEKLTKAGLKATGLKTHRALVGRQVLRKLRFVGGVKGHN